MWVFLMRWTMGLGALTADLAAQMNEGLALDAEIKIQLYSKRLEAGLFYHTKNQVQSL